MSNPNQNSTFVNVLGWIMLVFSGMGVLGAIMQNIMINFVMPSMMKMNPQMPSQEFPLTMFRLLGLILLLISVFVTFASYSFLQRRAWARKVFIALFIVGIVWGIICSIGFLVGFGFSGLTRNGANPMPPEAQLMFKAMAISFSIFTGAISILYSWILKKLFSHQVKTEFYTENPHPN